MKLRWHILIFILALILPISSACAKVFLHYNIKGIVGEPLENANKRLTGKLTVIKDDLDQDQLISFYQQAETEIKLALAPYGYFRAKVSSDLKKTGKYRWFASFYVRPGPKIRLRSLTVRIEGPGKNDPAFAHIHDDLPLRRGTFFNVKNYNDAKDLLINTAAQRGYFKAQMVTNKLEINQEPYGAMVTLIFNTGPRYQFGKVSFDYTEAPKKYLKESFLRRYIPFKKGDPYDNEQLSKMQTDLSSSQYFQSVNITPLINQTHGLLVPIKVKMKARHSQQYNFGLGFSTDSGVRGLTSLQIKPFTSTGHYLSFNAKASANQSDNTSEFKIGYNIPGHNPATDLYQINAEAQRARDNEVGSYKNLKANASYSNLFRGWQQTFALTLLYEHSEPVNEISRTTTFLIPNVRWIRLKADDPTSPTNGYRVNLSMRGASRGTLGSTNFFQVYLQTRYLKTIGDSFRVLARGDIGVMAISNTDTLPISLRFYAGGSQSVRGYHLNEIGSNESGRTISVGSIELQQRIIGNFYLAAFYDAGQVGPSYFSGYKQGVGGGLVWHSPIGAVSLTAAKAISTDGQPTLIQFSMGPEL